MAAPETLTESVYSCLEKRVFGQPTWNTPYEFQEKGRESGNCCWSRSTASEWFDQESTVQISDHERIASTKWRPGQSGSCVGSRLWKLTQEKCQAFDSHRIEGQHWPIGDWDHKKLDYLKFAEPFSCFNFLELVVCCNGTETTSGLRELINLQALFVVFVLLFPSTSVSLSVNKCREGKKWLTTHSHMIWDHMLLQAS